MKVIVTGGAGFIGSHFVDHLRATYCDNIEIVVIDSLTYAGNRRNLESALKFSNIKLMEFSILDVESYEEMFSEVDIVFNFAAETHVDQSIESPIKFSETNVLGTNKLLEVCRHKRIGKFVQISTDEVYGSTISESWDEESNLSPSSPYSASKAAADHLVQAYGKTFNLDVRITRSCNNYGPRQHGEKLIPKVIENIFKGLPIPIYGTGRNFREWIHVKDNCLAIDNVANKGIRGNIYNIGTGVRLNNLEVVQAIRDILFEVPSVIEFVTDRPGHDFGYSLDTSKLESLGFNPKIDFGNGIRETVEWYRDRFLNSGINKSSLST